MNAPLKAIDGQGKAKLEAAMRDIGRDARAAARALALAPAAQKNRALAAMAKAIRGSQAAILAANRGGFGRSQVCRRDRRPSSTA